MITPFYQKIVQTGCMNRIVLCFILLPMCAVFARGQSDSDSTYSVLIVTAHPDDDAMFAGSVYRLTHHFNSTVDLALITDGAGGFRYSVLSEPIYGIRLTDSTVAAEYLPAIRKKELMEGGAIVGIRNYHFFDQPDAGYTLEAMPFLTTAWDSAAIQRRLRDLMVDKDYDFVFVLLPRPDTHGHHKAASIYAIRAANELGSEGPLVLGAWISSAESAEPLLFETLDGYPETKPRTNESQFQFDRTSKFGVNNRLDYKIISNWLIAEHKSQGTMQLLVNRGDVEEYWILSSDSSNEKIELAEEMFGRLSIPWRPDR